MVKSEVGSRKAGVWRLFRALFQLFEFVVPAHPLVRPKYKIIQPSKQSPLLRPPFPLNLIAVKSGSPLAGEGNDQQNGHLNAQADARTQ